MQPVSMLALHLIALALCCGCAGGQPRWPAAVGQYRQLLAGFSKDVPRWSAAAGRLRAWMAATDPDYPVYHLTAPEGWANDPNGVTYDAGTGLYHRFFQYDRTYSDDCRHGRTSNCTVNGTVVPNAAARTWGHTVSKDLVLWQDWPGVDADSPWDRGGVLSGNCARMDDGSGRHVCMYSGFQNKPCDVAVCAYTHDWVMWKKTACASTPPSTASQTNHDTSIWRDGANGTW